MSTMSRKVKDTIYCAPTIEVPSNNQPEHLFRRADDDRKEVNRAARTRAQMKNRGLPRAVASETSENVVSTVCLRRSARLSRDTRTQGFLHGSVSNDSRRLVSENIDISVKDHSTDKKKSLTVPSSNTGHSTSKMADAVVGTFPTNSLEEIVFQEKGFGNVREGRQKDLSGGDLDIYQGNVPQDLKNSKHGASKTNEVVVSTATETRQLPGILSFDSIKSTENQLKYDRRPYSGYMNLKDLHECSIPPLFPARYTDEPVRRFTVPGKLRRNLPTQHDGNR